MSSSLDESKKILDILTEINNMQVLRAKISAAIYMRENANIVENKIREINESLKNGAVFYGENINKYEEENRSILDTYKQALEDIVEEYDVRYINLQAELQEAEANQQISIVNVKKMFDFKERYISGGEHDKYLKMKTNLETNLTNAETKIDYDNTDAKLKNLVNPLDEYTKKIDACIKKKEFYAELISECKKELSQLRFKRDEELRNINLCQTKELAKVNVIKKFINTILNKLISGKKFRVEVINKIKNQIEVFNNIEKTQKINNLREETVDLVIKIQGFKDKINETYMMALK